MVKSVGPLSFRHSMNRKMIFSIQNKLPKYPFLWQQKTSPFFLVGVSVKSQRQLDGRGHIIFYLDGHFLLSAQLKPFRAESLRFHFRSFHQKSSIAPLARSSKKSSQKFRSNDAMTSRLTTNKQELTSAKATLASVLLLSS